VVWLGRDVKDNLIPTIPPEAETPSTRLGCSKPHPAWPRRGSHSFSGQPVSVPHHPHSKELLSSI